MSLMTEVKVDDLMLVNKDMVNAKELLEQKLENSILTDCEIMLTMSTPVTEVRNIITPENVEYDDEYLCISDGNYELHINMEDVEIDYDDSYSESFVLSSNSYEGSRVYVEFI